jgi:hypothetical protein
VGVKERSLPMSSTTVCSFNIVLLPPLTQTIPWTRPNSLVSDSTCLVTTSPTPQPHTGGGAESKMGSGSFLKVLAKNFDVVSYC